MDDDAVERQLLQELSQLARGFDMFGGRVTPERQQAAIKQYEAILQRRAAAEAERRRVESDEQRVQTERAQALAEAEKARADAVRAQAEAEKARAEALHTTVLADLEAERVQIEKAALIVRALEVAAQAGVGGKDLLQAVQQIGVKLLGSDMAPLALEDKKKEEAKGS